MFVTYTIDKDCGVNTGFRSCILHKLRGKVKQCNGPLKQKKWYKYITFSMQHSLNYDALSALFLSYVGHIWRPIHPTNLA